MKTIISVLLSIMITATAFTLPTKVDAAEYLLPDYNEVIATIEKVNDYWITTHRNDVGVAFWERGAYNTGNIEAYALTGIKDYYDYSVKWADFNNWTGHPSNAPENEWTWGYSHDMRSKAVLFGDWQTCFQTYCDLYSFDEVKDEKKIARARQVMEYEMSTAEDGYWWWADGLFMVMPTMVKLYNVTDNPQYLDKLYEYYKFARELMYDGPGGIPESIEGYTSSARLVNGANYSDPEDYKYLFYRDANFVYPLNPVRGFETTKNFWARGNGWVFAALSKVLQETPDDWKYRGEFMDAYLGMAKALKNCQKFDDKGNGFWTQSLLIHEYSCDNNNPYGYETSGTAFFTYGLLWGINAGILPEEEYKDTALAGWKYLTEVATNDAGRVGYVQQVGGAAGRAAVVDNTQDFAVGATLLAGCEMARYVGGMQGYFYPYLQKRMTNMVALKVNSPYVYKKNAVSLIDANNNSVVPVIKNSRTLVPVRVISEGFGASVLWDADEKTVTVTKNATVIKMQIGNSEYTVNNTKYTLDTPPEIINDRTFLPIRAISEALGKIVYYNDAEKLIVVGYKNDVFMDCEENMERMLCDILSTGEIPESNPVFKDLCGLPAGLRDKALIKPVSATATAEPESFNNISMSIDGNIETRWASDVEADLVVDFGSVQYMEKIGVNFWKGGSGLRTTKFDLYVSKDGITYEQLFSGNSLNTVEFNVIDCMKEARYVKLHGYHNSENNWVNVYELAAYGKGTQMVTNLS